MSQFFYGLKTVHLNCPRSRKLLEVPFWRNATGITRHIFMFPSKYDSCIIFIAVVAVVGVLIRVEWPPWKIWNPMFRTLARRHSLWRRVKAWDVSFPNNCGNSTFINSFDKTKFVKKFMFHSPTRAAPQSLYKHYKLVYGNDRLQEPIRRSLHLPYRPLESTLSRVDL